MRRSTWLRFAAQLDDPLFDQPAVGFQLLFTRAAHADAGLDARQVSPHPLQPRQRVFELGQLHGQPSFVRARTRGENIEDHFGAIEHLDAQRALQIANLRGSKIVVEDDDVGVGRPNHQLQLFELSLAEIGRNVRRRAALGQTADNFRACGFHQAGEFFQVVAAGLLIGQLDADQNGRLALYALVPNDFLH